MFDAKQVERQEMIFFEELWNSYAEAIHADKKPNAFISLETMRAIIDNGGSQFQRFSIPDINLSLPLEIMNAMIEQETARFLNNLANWDDMEALGLFMGLNLFFEQVKFIINQIPKYSLTRMVVSHKFEQQFTEIINNAVNAMAIEIKAKTVLIGMKTFLIGLKPFLDGRKAFSTVQKLWFIYHFAKFFRIVRDSFDHLIKVYEHEN